ncbi:hypothetical protein BDN70DRAFT_819791 [Pholiota conissans]|uniref:Uncharacterized protein n=1 Tax=Pholiota conissans TaxID=109636 RepID=A0A9P5YKN4_9AGAR|nr:hypothetical protein BDN70DRAFT_819791 [Pholiota conissans]
MWDDTSQFWKGKSVLVIRDHHIPIVYWKEVYTSKGGIANWKMRQWEGTKSRYFDYKVLVEAMRRTSPNDFYKRFTVGGERLGYKAILKQLETERVAEDHRVAQLARNEYGSDFKQIFGYKKGRTWVVKTKACHIAEQYRKLKGNEGDKNGSGAS